VSRFQNHDERDIPRRHINGAPYNPRKISRDAMRRLRENIKRHKLHGALVVNERTAENGWKPDECGFFLVSGHQRLTVLDALEKSDAYEVRCAVGHWTPAEEREQNLHFNSPSAQGDTDIDMLRAMFEDASVELNVDAAGFDPVVLEDLGIMTGPLTEDDNTAEVQQVAAQTSAIAETAKEIQQAAREAKAEYRKRERENDKGAAFLIHLAFPSSRRCAEVLQLLDDAGFQRAGEYYNGESVIAAMGLAKSDSDA
jgi:hypothetical protein